MAELNSYQLLSGPQHEQIPSRNQPTHANSAGGGPREDNNDLENTVFLPDFDKSSWTWEGCIIAVIFGMIASIVCIAFGAHIFISRPNELAYPLSLTSSGKEVTAFFINLAIALCTDQMAYIHATSLRWALFRENRLQFSTNLRLFCSARTSPPNRWHTNLLYTASLVMCYAASSLLFIVGWNCHVNDSNCGIWLNGAAICGLAGHAALGSWCLVSSRDIIPTWSSNSLTITLAAMHTGQICHRPFRCMCSAHRAGSSRGPMHPCTRQQNASRANSSVRYVVAFTWLLAFLAVLWSIAIALIARHTQNLIADTPAWEFIPFWGDSSTDVPFAMSPWVNNSNSSNINYPFGLQYVLAFLFVCVIQGAQTLGLHCVELVVNTSRDEGLWSKASIFRAGKLRPKSGPPLTSKAFASAALSWENATLCIFKAALHWLIGLSLIPSVNDDPLKYFEFDMNYPPLIIYVLLAIAFAIFATYLSFRRPYGEQPAAWGHIQTLADLVDDWGSGKDKLWWGDKGVTVDGIRHAGTGPRRETLGMIKMDALYASD